MDKELQKNIPYYVQIMKWVRNAIITGEFISGERIPSVRKMAIYFEVNKNTIQRAVKGLEREGILVYERRVGRFVTSDQRFIDQLKRVAAEEATDMFRKRMTELGFRDNEIIFFLENHYKNSSKGN